MRHARPQFVRGSKFVSPADHQVVLEFGREELGSNVEIQQTVTSLDTHRTLIGIHPAIL